MSSYIADSSFYSFWNKPTRKEEMRQILYLHGKCNKRWGWNDVLNNIRGGGCCHDNVRRNTSNSGCSQCWTQYKFIKYLEVEIPVAWKGNCQSSSSWPLCKFRINWLEKRIIKSVIIRCNEGYELFLADDTDDHDVEGSNETTMSCVEGETYRPPQIPDCLESESPYTRSHEVEFSVLYHSGSFVFRQCSVTQ